MRKTILITGANSNIAQRLIPLLSPNYHIKLLSRNPQAANTYFWDVHTREIDEQALEDVSAIIHLAGSKLNDGSPLTAERMQLVRESRIDAADFLREKLQERKQQLDAFVSASAIGYYGFTDSGLEIDEEGDAGIGFNADLCIDWEAAADRFKSAGVAQHVSKIRVSLVFQPEAGIFPMYQRMLAQQPTLPQKDNGSSVPWNHVDDMAGIFAFALEKQLDGVYNSVAPEPASAQQVFQAIAHEFQGEAAPTATFHGKHLVAHKIIDAGYTFKYPTINAAIAAIKNNK